MLSTQTQYAACYSNPLISPSTQFYDGSGSFKSHPSIYLGPAEKVKD